MRARRDSCAASAFPELERVGPQSCLPSTRADDPSRVLGSVLLPARTPRDSSEGVSVKEDWKQSCTKKCSNADAVLFPACRRLISLPSLAAHHRMDMTDFPVRHLAQKAVELVFVTNISPTTIHEMLKKTGVIRGDIPPSDRGHIL